MLLLLVNRVRPYLDMEVGKRLGDFPKKIIRDEEIDKDRLVALEGAPAKGHIWKSP